MNKITYLTVLCFFSLFYSNAQEFTIGIKGGVNYSYIGDIESSRISFENPPSIPNEIFEPNKEFGTHFGGYLMVNFGKFFLRPEILFTKFNNSYPFPTQTSDWESSRVDIPLLVGYEIFEPINIYIGPVINSTSKMTFEGTENPVEYDQRDINFAGGVMLDFGRFGLDLRYEKSTTDEHPLNPNGGRKEADYIFSGEEGYGVNVAFLNPYKLGVISLTAHINIFRTDKDKAGNFFRGLFTGDKCYCPYD